jgi:hypothetical protein
MKIDLRSELAKIKAGLVKLDLTAGDAESIMGGRSAERLSDEKSLALVAFDADAVQAQVFASPRPVTIQGASTILREWDEGLQTGTQFAGDAVVLFAGGGQAVLVARQGYEPDKLAHRFREHTGGSPCTIASIDVSPRELVRGPAQASGPRVGEALARRLGWSPEPGAGFGACIARLSLALRAARGSKDAWFFLDAPTTAARCEECAERPRATGKLCARCRRNRDRGSTEKQTWEQARSFDEVLGEDALRTRHLAFLRFDGRGVGAQLEKLRTVAQYTALSLALRDAFEMRDLEGAFGIPEARYQIPIAGGDDLLVVVPARWKAEPGRPADAFSLCAALLDHVERSFAGADLAEHFPERDDLERIRKLGAGAGLVITSGMPASFCFDYTEKLVQSAKDALHGDHRSAVDFAVLRGGSPLATSLAELRERSLLDLDLGGELTGKVQRTRCPYVLAEFRDFLERTRLLGAAPSSALHALHAAMREPTTGMLAVRYQLARHRGLRAALVGTERLGTLPEQLGDWVLTKRNAATRAAGPTVWATAIGDLLDARPFVSGPAAHERGAGQ